MKYELKYIQPTSIVISSLPAILFCVGILGGFITFVVIPNPQLAPMTVMQKLMATGLTALVWMFLWIATMIVVAVLYNLFTRTVGMRGLKLEIEEVDEGEEVSESTQA